jgi:hypothetical protein
MILYDRRVIVAIFLEACSGGAWMHAGAKDIGCLSNRAPAIISGGSPFDRYVSY